ncbi:S-layer homology domain-containing protein [Paenibacillus oralis]|uniref:S-layer homology domain-containing protein n=1 Tax=Paenibacillus oralis TaxID=2490856 RepID=A0A3P3TW17_9BACL|nr:S-layer homology domain-containing protein [Paenibacillus oralis]RRJ62321.1 S-layer homology domain-containing protein [Paenibacillus oralis]
MLRKKTPLVWLLLLSLVISLVPIGLTPPAAQAATLKPTSYFTPDTAELRNTVDLTLDKSGTQISRDNVYHVTEAQLTVEGTYTKVTSSTLTANVQQLNWDPQQTKWVEDATKIIPGVIQLDTDRPDNRFKANLTLHSGMNRVTFSGSQGLNERSESFYILFDKVPYLDELKVLDGSSKLDLNQGARVVVQKNEITLQGKAQNATRINVSVNGGSALATTLLQDGTFFSPQLQMNPGLNDLSLVVQNGSDTLSFQYSLYYYDEKNPLVALYLVDSSDYPQDLLGRETPIFTEGATQARLFAQLLIPDAGSSFAGSATVQLDSTTVTPTYYESFDIGSDGKLSPKGGSEIYIPSVSQNTPAYRMVTFEINPLVFQTDANDSSIILQKQSHPLSITYGTKTINKSVDFQYMQGQTVITDLKYLNGYDGGDNIPSGEPLNGARVNSGEFYIMVTTNSKPNDAQNGLAANYMPLATQPISYEFVKSKSDTQHIYKITGFQNGNQTVRFNYQGSTAYKDATISFASKNYIYVANLTDGQSYPIDSDASKFLPINGKYVDFDNLDSQYFIAEVFANGLKVKSTSSEGPDSGWLNKTSGEFSFNLEVNVDTGPLVYGENRIVFTGSGTDSKGQTQQVKKELRIYIVDNNVSTIANFQPAVGKDRPDFPPRDFGSDDPQLSKIFNLTPDFTYKDKVYTTSLKTYDLVLRGSGAVKLNLNMGTKNILTADIPENSSGDADVKFADERYTYEFAGNRKDFIMRIHDLTNESPGTFIYTLELINETGAKTSQKLELVREAAPYRIISPQPTVGNQIIVNKNFVHFDIEAEGATEVKIDKEVAVARPDLGENRFVLDYVGLKQDKSNKIKIEISRGGTKNTDTIEVFYTGAVGIDAQYMAPKVANKYSVFNKSLELNFPKGTILESTDTRGIVKYYPQTKLLFGIADPSTGIVERRNDYGNVIGFPGTGEDSGIPSWSIPDEYLLNFSSNYDTRNFSRVSDIYWISGGLGEQGDKGEANYKPATNGVVPYSVEALFGDPQIPAERKITPSQRGTLKLKFDGNVVDEAGTTVTVYRYTPNKKWVNVGGVVDSKNNTITVSFDEFGYYTVMKMRRGYSDITNHSWARNILNALYAKGIMNNVRFEQFGADDQTTRGEFATLLVKGLDLPMNTDDNPTFADLVPGASSATWDYDHIETAARAGIVTGLSEGVFGPDQPITREQAAVMVARALKLKLPANDQKLKDALAKSFLDSGQIDTYAQPAIQAVTKGKIMAGLPVTQQGSKKASYNFNPKANMTRAEAGKIAVELLKKSKLFPKNLS